MGWNIEQSLEFIIDVHQEVMHDPSIASEDLTNSDRDQLIEDQMLVRCIAHNKEGYWRGSLDAYTVEQIVLLIQAVATIFKFRLGTHGFQLVEKGETK